MVGRRQLLWAGLAAGGIQLIGFITNYLVGLATGDQGSTTLLIVAGVVSVIGGILTLVLQQAMTPRQALAGAAGAVPPPMQYPGSAYRQPQQYPPPHGQPRPGNSGSSGGRLSLIVALILMIVLCGVGGTAATSFATAVIDKLSQGPTFPPHPTATPDKDDPFKPILAKAVSNTSGALTVQVTAAEANTKQIRLSVVATNTSNESMTLALFKNCLLSASGKPTLEAVPNSPFTETVPAKGETNGVIVFNGSLAGAAKARLSFNRIYSMDFNAPKNIALDLELIPTS